MTNLVLRAELMRGELDAEYLAEKAAEQPGLPPEELTPALWTVVWGWNGNMQDIEFAKDYQLPAAIGRVVAEATLRRRSLSWTLSGTPPEGGTVADAVDALGVTLRKQWPSEWR
ncbi:hypothetical protein [Nocardia sp. NRRL S-836]|uniref:hypothetical protein n=1 Tax=Nocardia sp. NRRL S-836 TaxID=1519492 RepID=UPI0006AE54BC|nr:hypothetical protein [Nocardia sp. NRRL S-836]KOV87588.1 hypothetical protein ADL03_06755 [Nocardia sp. NRRL S-836]